LFGALAHGGVEMASEPQSELGEQNACTTLSGGVRAQRRPIFATGGRSSIRVAAQASERVQEPAARIGIAAARGLR
jgi:hypothetical protein